MTLYIDTSDLMKVYVDEAGSAEVRELVSRADLVATSTITYAEALSTFARLRREAFMTAVQCSSAVAQLDMDWSRMLSIPVNDDLARAAGRLAVRLGLRGCDAIQLASFEGLASRTEDDLRFSSSDERLVKAAKKLG